MTEHDTTTNKENTVIKTGYYNLKDGIYVSEDGAYAVSNAGK